jgi:hypothetical protein
MIYIGSHGHGKKNEGQISLAKQLLHYYRNLRAHGLRKIGQICSKDKKGKRNEK